MAYIVVINGPSEVEDRNRLRYAREIYNPEKDILIADKFKKSLLEEELKDVPYVDVNEIPYDTLENALLAKEYIKDDDDIIVVTSDYHSERARKIFQKVFPNNKVEVRPVKVGKAEYTPILEGIKDLYYALILSFNPDFEGYRRFQELKRNGKSMIGRIVRR